MLFFILLLSFVFANSQNVAPMEEQKIHEMISDKMKTKEEKVASLNQMLQQLPDDKKQMAMDKYNKLIELADFTKNLATSAPEAVKKILEAHSEAKGHNKEMINKMIADLSESDRNQLTTLEAEIKKKADELQIKNPHDKRATKGKNSSSKDSSDSDSDSNSDSSQQNDQPMPITL